MPQPVSDVQDPALDITKSLAIPAASFLGIQAAGAKHVNDILKEKIAPGDTKSTIEALADQAGFPKERINYDAPNRFNAQYMPEFGGLLGDKGDRVHLNPRSIPEIASHEFGHSTMRDKGLLNRLRRGAAYTRLSAHPYFGAPLGLALSGGGYITDNTTLTDSGLAATAIPQGLALGEEALASIKGYNMLKNIGGNPRLSRYVWPFMTYAGGAGMAAGLPAYLSYKQHHRHDGENIKESQEHMPFKSKAQQRFMFAAEGRGDIPKGTAERWAKHTPDIKALPEHKKTASEIADAVIEKLASTRFVREFLHNPGSMLKELERRTPGLAASMQQPISERALRANSYAKQGPALGAVTDIGVAASNIADPFIPFTQKWIKDQARIDIRDARQLLRGGN